MPVIPSFGSFAPTPDLAGAYLGGEKLALEGQQLAASIAQQSQRMALEQAKLQQDAEQNQMMLAAKQAAAERDSMRQQQEMEIAKAYHDAQIGLQRQELQQKQQEFQLKASAAARQFAARQKFQSLVDAGEDPAKAMLSLGVEMGAPSGAFTASQRNNQAFIPNEIDVGGNKLTQMSPNRYAFSPKLNNADMTAVPVPGAEGQYQKIGNRVYPVRENPDAVSAKRDLKAFVTEHPADMPYLTGERVPATDLSKKRVQLLKPEYESLKQATLPKGLTAGTGTTPYKEGATIRNKKNGKLYRVVNGEPVLVGE